MIGRLRVLLVAAPLIAVMAGCRERTGSYVKLARYLQAERKINITVPSGPARADSLTVLARKSGIDPEREISRLRGNPESWEKLFKQLKELKDEK